MFTVSIMAKLILTDEERVTQTFLEWDEVTLGKAVKAVASICADNHGASGLKATGAAIFLISEAIKANSHCMTVDLTGATDGESDLGNWKVTIERQD
jgi:hypothetical protein